MQEGPDIGRALKKAQEQIETRVIDEPDPWGPLNKYVPKEWHGGFMFMGSVDHPHWGRVWHYKHGITRRYLRIDQAGNFYGERKDPVSGEYVLTQWADKNLAFDKVFKDIEKFGATRETKYDEGYKCKRDEALVKAGYTVAGVSPEGVKEKHEWGEVMYGENPGKEWIWQDTGRGSGYWYNTRTGERRWAGKGDRPKGNPGNVSTQKFEYVRTDDWGRKIYKDTTTGKYYVDVEGELHTMTQVGEPMYPIGVKIPVGNPGKHPETMAGTLPQYMESWGVSMNCKKCGKHIGKGEAFDMLGTDVYHPQCSPRKSGTGNLGQDKEKIINIMWSKTHPDYRSEPSSPTHPSILTLTEGGTTLVPLRNLTVPELEALAKKHRIEIPRGNPGNPGGAKIKPASITLTRAEGPHEEVGKPKTVTGERHSIWREADSVLRGWAGTAPATGGYDKIDFVVTYEDGQTYRGRYDLKHWSVESPDLGKHVSNFIKYYSGLYKPPHMSQEQYQQYLSTVTPQTIEETKRFYERYDVGE